MRLAFRGCPRARRAPVFAVHGFAGLAAKDGGEFGALDAALRGGLRRVGYYAGDTNMDVRALPDATTETSIDDIAAGLADVVRAAGEPVDLVGHSMGGLIVAAAVQELDPDAVRRVVLLGTPLAGLPSAVGCEARQCREMAPGSPWLATLRARGLRGDFVVGSEADADVPITSALACPDARRVLRLPATFGIDHGRLLDHPEVLRTTLRVLR